MIQFLVDECLSPDLVEVARQRGINAYHVARRGWSGDADPRLLARLLRDDLAFVTNNRADVRPMIARTGLHPGVVAILPNVRRYGQRMLFAAALAAIRDVDPPLDLVCTVLEVDADGGVRRYELPPCA